MSKSATIILAAGAIVEANEFLQNQTINWKAGVATFGAALFFAGLERLDVQAAVGLAAIALITVLAGGASHNVRPPFQELASLFSKPSAPTRVNIT